MEDNTDNEDNILMLTILTCLYQCVVLIVLIVIYPPKICEILLDPTQREGDALAVDIDRQDSHPHHLAQLDHL